MSALVSLLIASNLHAALLYDYARGHRRYQIHESRRELQLSNEGFTYVLPIDGCTRTSVDEFLRELEMHRARLTKAPAQMPERADVLRYRDEVYLLREPGLNSTAPAFFARTPDRFITLIVSEHRRCPKSFSAR